LRTSRPARALWIATRLSSSPSADVDVHSPPHTPLFPPPTLHHFPPTFFRCLWVLMLTSTPPPTPKCKSFTFLCLPTNKTTTPTGLFRLLGDIGRFWGHR
jgi:hypothetical protein